MLKQPQFCFKHFKTQTPFLSNQTNILKQQCRNTFILKRVHAPPLYKKYEFKPKLTHKHFIYKLVEDTNTRKQKNIDVILLKSVKNVGEKGEKVSIPSLRAYETLLLPKLAVYATPENLEKYQVLNEDAKRQEAEFSSQYVERTINILSQCYLSVAVSMDVPWTLEKWHIKVAFRRAGYIVPEDAITLPEKAISGPDLSIENKEFYIIVKINNCEEVKVRCRVHHHSSDSTKQIKYDTPYYLIPSTAIFPEDQPILNTLPKHRLLLAQNNDSNE